MKIYNNDFFDYKVFWRNEVNLNDFFTRRRDLNCGRVDFSNPAQVEKVIRENFFNCYGGYGEYRDFMWAGTYLEYKGFYHLGIDITMAAGTPIKCPFDCGVLEASVDKDMEIGWGGRYILKKDFCPNLVLAHIDPDTIKMPLNHTFKKGEIIGKIGTYPTNGNVWPHLHVQCYMSNDFKKLDGYGNYTDLTICPNPYEVEWGNLE